MLNYSKNKSFTLIELLVVIAIIGLLTSVVVVNMRGARAKARDSRRIFELQQINSALQLYYNTNETYPTFYGDDRGASWANLENALSPYLPKLPKDPLGGGVAGATSYYAYYPIDPSWWGGSSSCNGYNVLYVIGEGTLIHQECTPPSSAPISVIVGKTP